MTLKYDPRQRFRGDDPSRMMRKLAKGMLEQGEANGRRREQLVSAYTSRPVLEVRITHVRDSPPLWRLETLHPVAVNKYHGKPEYVVIHERSRELLMPELRHRCAQLLLQHGYVHLTSEEAAGLTPQQKAAAHWQKARTLAASVTIEERGLIVAADSERWAGERRR